MQYDLDRLRSEMTEIDQNLDEKTKNLESLKQEFDRKLDGLETLDRGLRDQNTRFGKALDKALSSAFPKRVF